MPPVRSCILRGVHGRNPRPRAITAKPRPAPLQAPAALPGADHGVPRSQALARPAAAGRRTPVIASWGSWREVRGSWEAGGRPKRREDAASGIQPPPCAHCLARTAGSSYLLTAKDVGFFSAPSPASFLLGCFPPTFQTAPPLSLSLAHPIFAPSTWVLLAGAPGPVSLLSPPHPQGVWSLPPTHQHGVPPEAQSSPRGFKPPVQVASWTSVGTSQRLLTLKYSTSSISFVSIKGISKLLMASGNFKVALPLPSPALPVSNLSLSVLPL